MSKVRNISTGRRFKTRRRRGRHGHSADAVRGRAESLVNLEQEERAVPPASVRNTRRRCQREVRVREMHIALVDSKRPLSRPRAPPSVVCSLQLASCVGCRCFDLSIIRVRATPVVDANYGATPPRTQSWHSQSITELFAPIDSAIHRMRTPRPEDPGTRHYNYRGQKLGEKPTMYGVDVSCHQKCSSHIGCSVSRRCRREYKGPFIPTFSGFS